MTPSIKYMGFQCLDVHVSTGFIRSDVEPVLGEFVPVDKSYKTV